jgi:hypothetical protein
VTAYLGESVKEIGKEKVAQNVTIFWLLHHFKK